MEIGLVVWQMFLSIWLILSGRKTPRECLISISDPLQILAFPKAADCAMIVPGGIPKTPRKKCQNILLHWVTPALVPLPCLLQLWVMTPVLALFTLVLQFWIPGLVLTCHHTSSQSTWQIQAPSPPYFGWGLTLQCKTHSIAYCQGIIRKLQNSPLTGRRAYSIIWSPLCTHNSQITKIYTTSCLDFWYVQYAKLFQQSHPTLMYVLEVPFKNVLRCLLSLQNDAGCADDGMQVRN